MPGKAEAPSGTANRGNLTLSSVDWIVLRQPLCVGGGQIHHQPDHGAGLVIEPENAGPADLDEPGQRRRRPHQKPPAGADQFDTIVADEPDEGKLSRVSRRDQIKRQPRFACSRRPADQDRARADQDRGSVDGSSSAQREHHIAGRRTMKRAPITLSSPAA